MIFDINSHVISHLSKINSSMLEMIFADGGGVVKFLSIDVKPTVKSFSISVMEFSLRDGSHYSLTAILENGIIQLLNMEKVASPKIHNVQIEFDNYDCLDGIYGISYYIDNIGEESKAGLLKVEMKKIFFDIIGKTNFNHENMRLKKMILNSINPDPNHSEIFLLRFLRKIRLL
jgi:hypothetical protein